MEKGMEMDIAAMAEAMGGDLEAGKVVANIVGANERFSELWELLQKVMDDFLTFAHGENVEKMVQMGWIAQKIIGEIMKLEPKPYVIGQ